MRDASHQRTERQRHETKEETSYGYFVHNILKDDGREEEGESESERVASTSHLSPIAISFASCVSDLFSLSFFFSFLFFFLRFDQRRHPVNSISQSSFIFSTSLYFFLFFPSESTTEEGNRKRPTKHQTV